MSRPIVLYFKGQIKFWPIRSHTKVQSEVSKKPSGGHSKHVNHGSLNQLRAKVELFGLDAKCYV